MQSEMIIFGLVRKSVKSRKENPPETDSIKFKISSKTPREALTFLLDNIYSRFGSKLCRQIVGTVVYLKLWTL